MKLIKQLKDWPRSLLVRWLVGLAVIVGLALLFLHLAEDVWFREGFAWDTTLTLALHTFSQPWLDGVMQMLTHTGCAGATLLVIVLAAWFVSRHLFLDAATTIMAFVGAVVLNAAFKLVFARPRPALFPPLEVVNNFSFPSGHVTAAVASYGLLAIFLWRRGHRLWALVSAAWVFVVAITRIYLGVHYPSDTLGSIAFGSLWLGTIFFIRDAYARRQSQSSTATAEPQDRA